MKTNFLIAVGKTRFLALLTVLMLISTQVWGDDVTIAVTIYASSGTYYAKTNSWSNSTQYDEVVLDDNISANRIGTGNNGKYYTDWRFYTNGSSDGSFSIEAKNGATLKSVTFTYTVSNSGALYYGTTKLTSGSAQAISGTSATFTTKNTNSSTNGQVRLTKISVTYSITTGDCDSDPTIGAAQINGSVNLTSVPVKVTGCKAGDNCSWTDYGFVWGTDSNDPTGNATNTGNSGTVTEWTHTLTGPFTVGQEYKYRAYGKNGKTGATVQYGAQGTFTIRQITFNSNGGGSVNTIYVVSGTKATKPTDPTKSGYTFAGWYTASDLNNAVDWNSSISENKTYYAKWTAKNYTLTWNLNGGKVTVAGTQANVNATGTPSGDVAYGTEITAPTVEKEGYNFTGWSPSVASTMPASNTTYVAQWTAKTYTVTWYVNGSEHTTGGGSTSVTFGNRVAAIPNNVTKDSGCGDKFIGWTTSEVSGQNNVPSPLYKTQSEFPTASGNQTFYAVFADYAD